VLNAILLIAGRPFLQHYCEEMDHFTPSITIDLTRGGGGEGGEGLKKIEMFLILYTNKYLKLLCLTT